MTASLRLLITSALAVVLAACLACGSPTTPDPQPRLRVLWYGRSGGGGSAFNPALLTVSLDDGTGPRVVRGADLLAGRELGMPTSAWLPVRDRDSLRVRVSVVAPSGDTLAAGAFARELEPDRRWDLGVHAGGINPCDPRSGAMGAGDCVALPLRHAGGAEAGDSMFVTWGANSIRDPWVTATPARRPPNEALQQTWPLTHHGVTPAVLLGRSDPRHAHWRRPRS